MTIEFTPWPKTPRLFRDAVITEKIDGTNAAVVVVDVTNHSLHGYDIGDPGVVEVDDRLFLVAAQSRKRLITPEDDNFGFAGYVRENAAGLAAILGTGVHFGEWWGSGIQRGYGLTNGDKRFSLFNVHRYRNVPSHPKDPRPRLVPGLGVVPVLDTHTFDTERARQALDHLRRYGSSAAPGFMSPEGVVVFHSAAGQVFKALLDNDHLPKGDVPCPS